MNLVLSVGTMIFGLAMLKGLFGKGTACLALLAGAVGIIGRILISVLPIFLVVGFFLSGIWCLLVGFKLFRLV